MGPKEFMQYMKKVQYCQNMPYSRAYKYALRAHYLKTDVIKNDGGRMRNMKSLSPTGYSDGIEGKPPSF